jgi:hypothetical protein
LLSTWGLDCCCSHRDEPCKRHQRECVQVTGRCHRSTHATPTRHWKQLAQRDSSYNTTATATADDPHARGRHSHPGRDATQRRVCFIVQKQRQLPRARGKRRAARTPLRTHRHHKSSSES